MTDPLTESTKDKEADQSGDAVGAAAAERPVSKVLASAVAGVLICAFLAIDALTPAVLNWRPGWEWLQAILLGFCIAQVNLIALWAALAPGNIIVRISWSMLLGAAMWYALILGERSSASMIFGDAIFLGLILLTGLIVLQIPLWIAKKDLSLAIGRLGRRPHSSRDGGPAIPSSTHAAGDVSPIGRTRAVAPVLPPHGADALNFAAEAFVGLAVVLLCNLVVTLPCVWWAFVSRTSAVLVAIGWPFYCAVLTGLEILVFCAVFSRPPAGQMLNIALLYYLLNVSQCAAVLGTLLIFRAIGFRLVRMPAADRTPHVPREAAAPRGEA